MKVSQTLLFSYLYFLCMLENIIVNAFLETLSDPNWSKKLRSDIREVFSPDFIEIIDLNAIQKNPKEFKEFKIKNDQITFSKKTMEQILEYIANNWIIDKIISQWKCICSRRKNGKDLPKNGARYGDIERKFKHFYRMDLIFMLGHLVNQGLLEKTEGLYYIKSTSNDEMEEESEKSKDEVWNETEEMMEKEAKEALEECLNEEKKEIDTESSVEEKTSQKLVTHPFVPTFTKKGVFISYDFMEYKQTEFGDMMTNLRWIKNRAEEFKQLMGENYPLTIEKAQYILSLRPRSEIRWLLEDWIKLAKEYIGETYDLENIEILDIDDVDLDAMPSIDDVEIKDVEIEDVDLESEKREEIEKINVTEITYVTEIQPYPEWTSDHLSSIQSGRKTTRDRLETLHQYQIYKKSGMEEEKIREKMEKKEIEIVDIDENDIQIKNDDSSVPKSQSPQKKPQILSRKAPSIQDPQPKNREERIYDHERRRLDRNCKKNNLARIEKKEAYRLFDFFYQKFVNEGHHRPSDISPISVYFSVQNGKRSVIRKKYGISESLLKDATFLLQNEST